MARAKRHYLPGHVWHHTHQASPSALGFAFSYDPTGRPDKSVPQKGILGEIRQRPQALELVEKILLKG